MNPFEWIKAAAYGALGALVAMLYYEGLPGVSRIPFATSVPIVGELLAGEKHVYADEKVKAATASLVSAGELAAAKAVAEKAQREADQNRKAADEARDQLLAAKLTEQTKNERYDQAVAADTDDGPVVTDGDLIWLRNNR